VLYVQGVPQDGLQIDLDESIDHVEPKHRVNMKALLSWQLVTC
jgi:hypothetical protein